MMVVDVVVALAMSENCGRMLYGMCDAGDVGQGACWFFHENSAPGRLHMDKSVWCGIGRPHDVPRIACGRCACELFI